MSRRSPRPAPPARSTAGRSAAASTATTASWMPRPTSTRPSWCATTRRSIRPGNFASGYHLTADLVDQAIRYLADHVADNEKTPWLTWLALGACHAPHQAPFDLIKKYDALFAHGWDVEREQRLARQIELGIVPEGHAPAAAQRHGARLGRRARGRAAPVHAPAGGLRRHARPCRPASRAADGLPRDGRPARRHAGRDHVRQRRQPGGRAVRHGQRHGSLQPEARADRGEDRAHRRYRRARHPFQLPAGLGDGRQHAAAPLQAEHPRRRHPRSPGHGLEQGHRRQGRAAPPVLPRQRPRADPARGRRRQAAQGDQRRQADADRGHQLRQESRPRPRRRRRRSRSTSRCSAIAAWCRTVSRPCASIRRATPSTTTSGSSTVSTATSTRSTISPSASPSG